MLNAYDLWNFGRFSRQVVSTDRDWSPQCGVEDGNCIRSTKYCCHLRHSPHNHALLVNSLIQCSTNVPSPCNRTEADTKDVIGSFSGNSSIPSACAASILIETATLQAVVRSAASWLQSSTQYTSALRYSPSSYQQSWPQRKSSQQKWGLGYCCGECSSTCSC